MVYDVAVVEGGIAGLTSAAYLRDPGYRQWEIDVAWVESRVSIGIENEVVPLLSEKSLLDYRNLLVSQLPGTSRGIRDIVGDIERVMGYMEVFYGIDNPLLPETRDEYLHGYNETGIKMSPGAVRPAEYRKSLGMTG